MFPSAIVILFDRIYSYRGAEFLWYGSSFGFWRFASRHLRTGLTNCSLVYEYSCNSERRKECFDVGAVDGDAGDISSGGLLVPKFPLQPGL